MLKKLSSEKIFGLNRHPMNACPSVDAFLESIRGIGDTESVLINEDEEDDEDFEPEYEEVPIELDVDDSAISDLISLAEEMQNWFDSWEEFSIDILVPFLEECLENFEDWHGIVNDYYNEDNLEDIIKELSDGAKDCRKSIKEEVDDLVYQISCLTDPVDKNDPYAIDMAEDVRSRFSDLRSIITDFKNNIKPFAFDFFEHISSLSMNYEVYIKHENERKRQALDEKMKKLKKEKSTKKITQGMDFS